MRFTLKFITATLFAVSVGVNAETVVEKARKAADYATSHAYSSSQGWCAKYVANALIYGGGFSFTRQGSAYMYHSNGILRNIGFSENSNVLSSPNKGDICVTMPPSNAYPDGHIAIYNGSKWVSDFIQNSVNVYGGGLRNDKHCYRGSGGNGGGNGGNGSKKWYPYVTGYNINDPNNGYAGKLGVPVTGLAVDGGREYKVHIKGGRWLSSVTGNDINEPNNGYAGTIKGDAIDGVAIQGGVKYRVHVMGKGWLPEVTGYNINDSIHGYAGILGQTIDAVMINGRRYATSHN